MYRHIFRDCGDLEGRNFTTLHQIALCLDGRDLKAYLQNCSRVNINKGDDRGRTALHWAVRRGDLAKVKLLLQHGANPNITSQSGSNSLYFAAQSGHASVIDLLLQYGVEVNQSNSAGLTPLMMQCLLRTAYPACVQHLIDGGAKINLQDYQGATALMYAAFCGSPTLTLLHLLNNGALVNMQTLAGETALTLAIQSNSHKAIPILISHGADVTHHTRSKRSLLHSAAESGDEATLAILSLACICGIDANQGDMNGTSAWDLARARDDVSPEWRAAFSDLVASINPHIPEPTAESESERSAKATAVPRVRLSDLIRVVEDNLYRWTILANHDLNGMLLMSFSASFLVFGIVLAFAWRILVGS